MSESGRNIFLHHVDDTKDDICDSSKKIQPGRKDIMPSSHFLRAISVKPSPHMDINLA
jgi:hypothetical protein